MGNKSDVSEVIKHAELEMILQKSSDNIVITDGEGVILQSSSNFQRIYGIPVADILGRSVQELQQNNILRPSVTLEVLKEKKEVQLMQKTDSGLQVMASGFPIFNRDGDIARVISFSRDLTDLQMLQQEYELLQKRLFSVAATDDEQNEKIAGLAFRSRAVREIIQLIRRIAGSQASVLFQGESGVGKTAFARLIHQLSERKSAPFIEVNCSAIPENLFESEMFGYAPGSFSGALRQGKAGLIESADGGTLFLDEVGELPQAMQAKLLKVLQDGYVTRVGSVEPIKTDFRLITASNRQLSEMVQSGEFRLDLFYRVNVVPIHIPALRERKEDIPVLAQHILEKLNQRYQQKKLLPQPLLAKLSQSDWPGNIRELENIIERCYVASPGEFLQNVESGISPAQPGVFPNDRLGFDGDPSLDEALMGNDLGGEGLTDRNLTGKGLKEILEEVERQVLIKAAAKSQSTYELAERLQISQPSTVRKLQKYGVELPFARRRKRR